MLHRFHLPIAILLVSATCFVAIPDGASAQAPPATVTNPETDANAESVMDTADADPNIAPVEVIDPDEQKRQTAVAALLILSLVCVVFLFLILFVVMWSKRMRRLVNQPLPDQHPGDPLWYLRKPDSNPVSEPNPVSDSED
jgi:lipopolysaccharide export LptBFGC system permease protein LptF